MRRRLGRIFENETIFAVGVICLGLLSVAIMVVALFLK
jgi:hypothetical protein